MFDTTHFYIVFKKLLTQWFSTGFLNHLPSPPGDIWPCLGTFLHVTVGWGWGGGVCYWHLVSTEARDD